MTSVNVATWGPDTRRLGSLVVLGVAAVVALGAVAVWWFVQTAPAWLWWALLAPIVLVLAFLVLLFVAKPRAASAAEAPPVPAHDEHAAHGHAPEAPAPTPAFEPRTLTLRCGDCGTIFDVTDTGERPLYHTCPGCGAEGALRDPLEGAPEAAATAPPEAAPQAAPEPAPAPAATPAPAPAAPPVVKKLKLRCGGCKEVFTIEDSGERPLRRACPHCGRMGQIN